MCELEAPNVFNNLHTSYNPHTAGFIYNWLYIKKGWPKPKTMGRVNLISSRQQIICVCYYIYMCSFSLPLFFIFINSLMFNCIQINLNKIIQYIDDTSSSAVTGCSLTADVAWTLLDSSMHCFESVKHLSNR